MIAPEVIQKLNVLGVARTARRAVQDFGAGVRVGATHSYPVARAGRTGTLHVVASRAGLSGVRTGIRAGVGAGHAVRVLAPRVAAARARGAMIGARIRGSARGLAARARLAANNAAGDARVGYSVGSRGRLIPALRLSEPAYRAGVAAGFGAHAGRTWVHNARVAGGGFWRRLRG